MKGILDWNWHDFVHMNGSKKGSSSTLGAAATQPVTNAYVRIMVTSIPPSHTINSAELAGIEIDLQLNHTHLLTDSACSLCLSKGLMRCATAYRHHIHREALELIPHALHTRSKSGIRTHLCKIKAHNHSLGNDHADALANQVTHGHNPDTTFTTGVWGMSV
jgi:ribonuclease HI